MQVAIKDILPNPFRNMAHYKINEKRVQALIKSYETTGMWPVIIGRKNAKGKIELAFGHHRKEAAERHYGKDHKIEIIIQDLSDEEMLKMMANENQQDFATSFITEMETIQAVVQAFADGKIQLEVIDINTKNHQKRYAPSFIVGGNHVGNPNKVYTPIIIARFLGWTYTNKEGRNTGQPRVYKASSALELIEQGYLNLIQFEDLNFEACDRIISQAIKERETRLDALNKSEKALKKAEADLKKVIGTSQEEDAKFQVQQAENLVEADKQALETKPAEAGEAVAKVERDKKKKSKEASEAAAEAVNRLPKELPDINDAANALKAQIERCISSKDDIGKKLNEILEFKEHLTEGHRRLLISAMERLHKRVEKQTTKLKAPALPAAATRKTYPRLLPAA